MTNDYKRTLIDEYMNKLGKQTLNTDEILELIENNEQLRYQIFVDYERDNHKQDILNEIDCLNEDREENEQIHITDELLDNIVEDYEDKLADSEDWHFILRATLNRFDIGD